LYNIKRKFVPGEALKLPITAQYQLICPQRRHYLRPKKRHWTGLRKSQLGLGKLVISIMRKVGLIKLEWQW